jgi:hypothetical protein
MAKIHVRNVAYNKFNILSRFDCLFGCSFFFRWKEEHSIEVRIGIALPDISVILQTWIKLEYYSVYYAHAYL